MASSEVEVCNDALARLGDRFITALDEDSTAAKLCARQYPLARDHVLARYAWNCAMGRVRLAADTTAPAWGFTYAYPLPADCLRVVEVSGELDGMRWRVEGRRVMSDEAGPLDIRFIRRLEDVGLWSPPLADAVAAQLAARIAYGLTGNATIAQAMRQEAERTFVDAKRLDAIEQSQDEEIVADTWERARFSAYGQTGARWGGRRMAAAPGTPTTPGVFGGSSPVFELDFDALDSEDTLS